MRQPRLSVSSRATELSERHGEVEAERGHEDDSRAIDERARWYLARHGDRGRIDSVRRLAAVRAEYARRIDLRRAERGKSPRGVGGAQWISLGPTNGAGRMTALAPHPTRAGIVYAGAAGGGVWKTVDGGATWICLTDDLPDLSVGALALAPSNPSIVYLGTGEGDLASAEIPGIGLLKSVDGGVTWRLPQTVLATHFHRIRVHPTNPDELVVGTNAGAFRSTDGGSTWSNVIDPSQYGEVADLVRAADDARILYATTWCITRQCMFYSSHVLKSVDGGVTWSDRSNGLPFVTRGGSRERLSIAVSPSKPSVLYAARTISDFNSGAVTSHVYKSTDAAATWRDISTSPTAGPATTYLGFQSFYDNVLAVSPTDPNVLIAGGVGQIRTPDGGASFTQISEGDLHPDCHDLQYQGSTLWIANDGGVYTSTDDSVTATPHNTGLVTRQYYALSSDRSSRTRIVAGSQDNGNVLRTDASTAWRNLFNAGDGFQSAIHPLAPTLMWNSSQGVQILRSTDATSDAPHFLDVSPPLDDQELRPFFTIVRLDPSSGSTLYTGTVRVWRSRDGGDTWAALPTSTSDGSVWSMDTLMTSIALTPSSSQAILAAKTDGVFRSDDGGQTWRAGRGLPNAATTSVEIDPKDPLRAYATIATTAGPSLYRSEDGGSTWAPSASGLPPAFAAQSVRVDPTDSTDLFCGTDVGVYRSTDRGATWSRFGEGLPAVSVHDVDVFEDGSLLRIATYGRGVWELAIPPVPNSPPVASIASPAGSVAIVVGAAIDFSGSVHDSDIGDAASGEWFFSDDGSRIPLGGASGSMRHLFRRAGVFPVSLAATDTHGARGTETVIVSVRETADACSTPALFPGSGPFPYTIRVEDRDGTLEASDPTPPCYGGTAPVAYTTWFEFTPETAGTYEFSTCGADAVTMLSLYTGPACGPFAPVAGACKMTGLTDTDCGPAASGMLVSATVPAGQTLRVLLSSDPQYPGGSVPVTLSKAGLARGLRVLRVSGETGPTSGGTTVTVSGSGLLSASTVLFGGAPATDVLLSNSSTLTARTPAHAAGAVDVSVTTPGGLTAVLQNAYRYDDSLVAPCLPTPTSLCVGGGRFRVEASWLVEVQGSSGAGAAVPLTSDTGYFWFFSPNNVELVVKIVDGRAVNGKFWVFYGALSDVAYTITVTDLATGEVRTYVNPAGHLASAADTSAF